MGLMKKTPVVSQVPTEDAATKWTRIATGTAVGFGAGTVTTGPIGAAFGAAFGGKNAQITGALGLGIGIMVSSIFGGVAGEVVNERISKKGVESK